jgi:hypothetical protein
VVQSELVGYKGPCKKVRQPPETFPHLPLRRDKSKCFVIELANVPNAIKCMPYSGD